MTDVYPQRLLASRLLKCGINRVWINPDSLADVSLALTASDINKLILDGVIRKKQIIGISRGRARERHQALKRNQQKGPGKRKGSKTAGPNKNKKTLWINRIRPQRRYLKALRDKGLIEKSDYRHIYRKAKGGQYRSVSYLKNQLEEQNLIKSPSVAARKRRR
jgi:large subunit ribosomal protein L19e